MSVRDTETAFGKKLKKELEKLQKMEVVIGFTEGGSGYGKSHESVNADDYEDGTSVVDVAMWNEFGTATIPPRPFMRQSIDNSEDKIIKMGQAQLQGIIKGSQTAEGALQAIGALQVGFAQNEIREGGFVPNAPSTIAKKKDPDSRPLIDSGHMRQSVHYVVREKEGR